MTRPFEAYLYCVEIVGGNIAKIGVSSKPKTRITALAATGPFDLRFHRVIGFTSRRIADAWERHIIASANRYRARGEWVLCDQRLDSLLDGLTEGVDCTAGLDGIMSCGRVIPQSVDVSDVQSVIVRERLTGVDLRGIEFNGDPDDYMPAIVRGRLRQGFGVEDIAAMDEFRLADVRAVVADIRDQQMMQTVLFGLSPADQGAAS